MKSKAAPNTAMPKETPAAHIQAVPCSDNNEEKSMAMIATGSPRTAIMSGGKFLSE